mgnify:CR=1 FL=1
MNVVCLDLEGVLVPEIWIAFAKASGIPELERTTRDEPDYDKLMNSRLDILREHGLGLAEIQDVIATIDPMEGAREFLDALRENNVTVTFYNQDGDEVTIPAGMAPKSLRDSWTYKQLGNYVLSLDEVVTEVEETTETTETTQPAAEQTAPTTETAKPNPETGDASSSMMAIAAAAASLCGVVLLSKKNK